MHACDVETIHHVRSPGGDVVQPIQLDVFRKYYRSAREGRIDTIPN
jgi:outer membrane lipopolysaccharide assembly protein LptE/RlpB